jgi:integrase/recombinase XerC
MERMKPPPLPEQPVEVVGSEHVAWLLKTCEGRDFTSRRDSAVILVPVDTGMRLASTDVVYEGHEQGLLDGPTLSSRS